MVDFVVRFVGDLSQLASFNSTIRNSMLANSQIMNQASLAVASRSVGENVAAGPGNSAGLYMTNAKSSIDSFNNSLQQSGTIMRQFISGYTTEADKLGRVQVKPLFGQAYHADFNLAIADAENYARAVSKLAPLDSLALGQQQSLMMRSASRQNLANDINTFVAQEKAQTKAMTAVIAGKTAAPLISNEVLIAQAADLERRARAVLPPEQLAAMGGVIPGLTGYVPPKITREYDILEKTKGEMTYGSMATANAAMIGTTGVNLGTYIEKVLTDSHEADIVATEAAVRRAENTPAAQYLRQSAMVAALSPEGRIGTKATNLLENYPDIRKDLIRGSNLGAGAAYGTPQFFENAQKQGFTVTQYSKDMERGLTQIKGSLADADGMMNNFTYSIDKNGKAVNTWGRSLSGSRGFLNQTSRDFIKVIEWTVATTAVFGALGIAVSALSKINTLNSDLQRLAITAKLTKGETADMFSGLAQVAKETATPIDELVKASDDMALATRNANQTTDQWRESILKLATAVGILTNISGMDTVSATELLTASMKQLDLTAQGTLDLLNKVAAAAGGQANSITDIVQSLGTLSEAGLEAGMTVEQQIAAVQVISQVTGKSADQVATAFKNLFGSIDSTASVKKLAEFGIAVRDSEGNLRPFLSIYKDIQTAFEQGIIPEGRIKEVIKAIAGGPRRAPDAAALLSNINRVDQVTAIANNASNEALIANAQVLDTNKAKIIQLQNAWDVSIFQKLNDTIENLTNTLLQLGVIVSNVLGVIPAQVYQIVIQGGLLLALFTGLGKVLGMLSGNRFFSNLITGITGAKREVAALNAVAGVTSGAVATGEMAAEAKAAQNAAMQAFANQQANPTLWMLNSEASRTAAAERAVSVTEARLAEPLFPLAGGAGYTAPLSPYPTYTPRQIPYVPVYPTNPSLLGVNYGPRGALTEEEMSLRRATYFSRPEALQQAIPFRSSEKYRGLTGELPVTTASMLPVRNLTSGELAARLESIGITTEASTMNKILAAFSRIAKGGIKNPVGGAVIGGVAAAGALGAASATGGADLVSMLSQIGSLGGIGLAMAQPELAPLGIGISLVSGLLPAFIGNSDTARKKALDLEKGLYDLTEQWKSQQTAMAALDESYATISASLATATTGTQKYLDLTEQLGEITLQKAQAQQTQSQNFDAILKQLAALEGTDSSKWKSIADALKAGGIGNLSPATLNQIVPVLSQDILNASGNPVSLSQASANQRIDVSKLIFGGSLGTVGSLLPTGRGSAGTALSRPVSTSFDVLDLLNTPSRVNDLIGNLGKTVNFPVNATTQAVYLGALQAQKTAGAIDTNKFNAAVDEFWNYAKAANEGITAISNQITGYKGNVEALGILGVLQGPELANAQARAASAEQLQAVFGNLPLNQAAPLAGDTRSEGRYLPAVTGPTQQSTAQFLQSFLFDQSGKPNGAIISAEDARKEADAVFAGMKIGNENLLDFLTRTGQLVGAEAGYWKNLGQEIKGVTDIGVNGTKEMDQALIDFIKHTKSIGQDWRQQAGQKLLDLQAQMQTPGITSKEIQQNLVQQAQQKAILSAGTKLDDIFAPTNISAKNATKAIGIFEKAMNSLQVNGFQGLPPTIDAVTGAIFSLVTTLNLTGPQIAQYILLVADAMRIAQQLASLPSIAFTGLENQAEEQLKLKQAAAANNARDTLSQQLAKDAQQLKNLGGQGRPFSTGGSAPSAPKPGTIYLSDQVRALEAAGQLNVAELVKKSYADALKLQAQVPGATKENAKDIVVIFDGLKRVMTARGVAEEFLTKAIDENTSQLKIQNESKADTIRRIRVGSGDFAAFANVPLNTKTGVSVGSPTGPISINLDINGQLLTPAQFTQWANQIAAALKAAIAAGAG